MTDAVICVRQPILCARRAAPPSLLGLIMEDIGCVRSARSGCPQRAGNPADLSRHSCADLASHRASSWEADWRFRPG